MNLALTCVSAKNDYRRPNGSARKEKCLHVYACVFRRAQVGAWRVRGKRESRNAQMEEHKNHNC